MGGLDVFGTFYEALVYRVYYPCGGGDVEEEEYEIPIHSLQKFMETWGNVILIIVDSVG